MVGLPSPVDTRLRHRQWQCPAVLHLAVGGPGLRPAHPRQRVRGALRLDLERRALSAVPLRLRERDAARRVPRLRIALESLAGAGVHASTAPPLSAIAVAIMAKAPR